MPVALDPISSLPTMPDLALARDATRLNREQYEALRAAFGDELLRGGYGGLDRRLLSSDAGRQKLAEVLGRLGISAEGNDRTSLQQGIRQAQGLAGLPQTGDLELALLVLLALAAQRGAGGADQPGGWDGLAPGGRRAPMFGAGGPPGSVPARTFMDPGSGRPGGGGGSTIDVTSGVSGSGPLNQKQHHGKACGQTAAAMFISKARGVPMGSREFENTHGYGLKAGMAAESRKDIGDTNVGPGSKELLMRAAKGDGAVLGLSSPYGSPHGHIYYLKGYDQATDRFTLANPADGKDVQVSFEDILRDRGHSDGKFLFYNKADVR
jgi:hypothetical protein